MSLLLLTVSFKVFVVAHRAKTIKLCHCPSTYGPDSKYTVGIQDITLLGQFLISRSLFRSAELPGNV